MRIKSRRPVINKKQYVYVNNQNPLSTSIVEGCSFFFNSSGVFLFWTCYYMDLTAKRTPIGATSIENQIT